MTIPGFTSIIKALYFRKIPWILFWLRTINISKLLISLTATRIIKTVIKQIYQRDLVIVYLAVKTIQIIIQKEVDIINLNK